MVNTARFFLSRLESLSAAPTSLSFLQFRSKSSKSSAGGQGLVAFPVCAQLLRTATHLFPAHAPKRRDCVIYSVPHPLHSINPTDSPDSRISVGALVVLSVSLCQSRKDPYLPLHPQCVRLLPRTHVLACSRFQKQFAIRLRGRQITSSTVEPKDVLPLERLCVLDLHLPRDQISF